MKIETLENAPVGRSEKLDENFALYRM